MLMSSKNSVNERLVCCTFVAGLAQPLLSFFQTEANSSALY